MAEGYQTKHNSKLSLKKKKKLKRGQGKLAQKTHHARAVLEGLTPGVACAGRVLHLLDKEPAGELTSR